MHSRCRRSVCPATALQAKQVTTLITKELTDSKASAAAPLNTLTRKLEDRWKAIEALQVR
jgi:hypothetical protein